MNNQKIKLLGLFEGLIIKISEWVGTPESIFIHTILFISTFGLRLVGVPLETIFLALTTVISLEAIYLSLFIQMSVNRSNLAIEEISEDVDDIIEDIDDLDKDIDNLQHDIDEMSDDIDEISEDVDDITESVTNTIATSTVVSNNDIFKLLTNLEAKINKLEKTIEKQKINP
jgi:uncharacterized membrane protein